MTNDELKAAWGGDIDSYEKFDEVYNRTRAFLPRTALQGYAYLLPRADGGSLGFANGGNLHNWPVWRDHIRECIGFYPEPTSVIKWMRQQTSATGAGQMFPHVSPINRMEIAFTPDGNQGQRDRKQRMTPGRFLRKFLMYAPDAEIQRLEQVHRSELDTEFKLAETVEAIYRVYREMDGDTGCMRHDLNHFGHDEYHPSAVYASPNMGVAYTEDENGTVKSRSVVWINPDDPSDKRYVRIYGDPILKKKLEANGYRLRGLVGAKLRILHDPSFHSSQMVVMPWIDPAGGIHATGVDRSYDGTHAVRFKGEDYFTILSSEEQARYQRAGIYPTDIQSQSGHAEIPEVDPAGFIFVCPLSGARVDRMRSGSQLWIDANGTILRASEAAISRRTDLVLLQAHVEGRMQQAYCEVETKKLFAIPGFPHHYNDEPTREALGLAILDPLYYGQNMWASRLECVFLEGADGTQTFIKKEDAVYLYVEGDDKYIHESLVKAMRKEGCVPVAVRNGYRGLAHKDHAKLRVTRGGKRVMLGYHDVAELYDGSYEYSRNVKSMNVAGLNLVIHKEDDPRQIEVTLERVKTFYKDVFQLGYRTGGGEDDMRRRKTRMIQRMSNGFQGGPTYIRKDDTIVSTDYYNKPTDPQQMFDAAAGIMAMKDDTEWLRRILGYNWHNALPWAKVVTLVHTAMKEFDAEYAMALAEANAVEAPLPTSQLVAQVNALPSNALDILVAEVDEALATSVIRRWPRLATVGNEMREAREQREAIDRDYTVVATVHDEVIVTPIEQQPGRLHRVGFGSETVTLTHPGAEHHLERHMQDTSLEDRNPPIQGLQATGVWMDEMGIEPQDQEVLVQQGIVEPDMPVRTTTDADGTVRLEPVQMLNPAAAWPVTAREREAANAVASTQAVIAEARQIAEDTFGPVPAVPEVRRPPLITEDDELLAALGAAGLTTLVIDETTEFPVLPHRPESNE